MIGPNDLSKLELENSRYTIKEMIQDVDEGMKKQHGWYPWEHSVIDYEISKSMRNRIAEQYIKAGWKYVYHHTTTENNERPGLTAFTFSMEKLDPKYINRMWEVTSEGCIWIQKESSEG